MKKVKSIDSLMAYMRNTHNIKIKGSSQKVKLRNLGYYHGYKGYRFIGNPSNKIPFTDFNEIISVSDFDMKLKSLFYSQIMFIETAVKNYVLEIVLDEGKNESFNSIYTNLLTSYKAFPTGSKKYKDSFKTRLNLRNIIYRNLTRDYNKMVIKHFYHKDSSVPIWAIFEIITLGEFATFISCLNSNIRSRISLSLKLNQACDSDGELSQNIIYTVKDLRNSIAHNGIIFDTRFRTASPSADIVKCLEFDTKIKNINFGSIVDYVILVAYILINLRVSKTEINKFVSNFETVVESFRKQIPISVFNKIIFTQTKSKINELRKFIKNS